ncbi:DUF2809 domain-containing protein [Flavobacterium sp. NRK F7]|uniref:ribosomal maturation YjgA family protein n=1 Tax=Flavobacterium sp. NRK F7 TaxID=2954930 RepID=UPI0020904BCE|nr:DUF2809 domain-containing protein [Flavobacterium sp. NRK F7]MCO6163116.1 DUF2809 domain-containing protein [Flavobacterium sp. NRK F7]
MFQFKKHYFIATILLFLIEVGIALYIHDDFIRPYIGDVLVVLLLYCCMQSFFTFSVKATAIFVLLFSFTIEFLQYIHIVEKLSLQKYAIARTVLGTSFSWIDLLCYTIGVILILLIEKRGLPRKN